MSNRSLIELNHDFCPTFGTQRAENWLAAMIDYMRSGDPRLLPDGAELKATRHHSDPEFKLEGAR